MKALLVVSLMIALYPTTLMANNVFRQLSDANTMNPRVACQNPNYGFSPKEVDICMGVYQTCMRPDLKQVERDRCLIDAVQKGSRTTSQAKNPDNSPTKKGEAAAKKDDIVFHFTSYQAYDLVELCELKANKARPLCAGAVLPNKAKIMADIREARQ
jgi:hypothetical protein